MVGSPIILLIPDYKYMKYERFRHKKVYEEILPFLSFYSTSGPFAALQATLLLQYTFNMT